MGTVKWFRGASGFGIIAADRKSRDPQRDGTHRAYSVRYADIDGNPPKLLEEGQRVTFAACRVRGSGMQAAVRVARLCDLPPGIAGL